MKEELKEDFKKRKILGSCLDNPQRKVEVLNLREIHLDQVLSLLARPRHFDLHNRLDLVQPRQVLLPKDELHQRDAHVVVKFIWDPVVHLKYVFSVGRQVMSRGFVQCQIQLLQ